ncbi:hypothetical protein NDU88_006269 [Pleurodeles waltl]|uniref:Uncharacterized protein n=1 Tax=Pleurodeles waltl TaxID=8319 RepID=A0AAV7LP25_PLEWA|nr:hypothetical protein NDU88_006269 [Pleurodeles waltl]
MRSHRGAAQPRCMTAPADALTRGSTLCGWQCGEKTAGCEGAERPQEDAGPGHRAAPVGRHDKHEDPAPVLHLRHTAHSTQDPTKGLHLLEDMISTRTQPQCSTCGMQYAEDAEPGHRAAPAGRHDKQKTQPQRSTMDMQHPAPGLHLLEGMRSTQDLALASTFLAAHIAEHQNFSN